MFLMGISMDWLLSMSCVKREYVYNVYNGEVLRRVSSKYMRFLSIYLSCSYKLCLVVSDYASWYQTTPVPPCDRIILNEPEYWRHHVTVWTSILAPRCGRMDLNTNAVWLNQPQYWRHHVTGSTSILAPPCDRINLNIGATMWQDQPQYWRDDSIDRMDLPYAEPICINLPICSTKFNCKYTMYATFASKCCRRPVLPKHV